MMFIGSKIAGAYFKEYQKARANIKIKLQEKHKLIEFTYEQIQNLLVIL